MTSQFKEPPQSSEHLQMIFDRSTASQARRMTKNPAILNPEAPPALVKFIEAQARDIMGKCVINTSGRSGGLYSQSFEWVCKRFDDHLYCLRQTERFVLNGEQLERLKLVIFNEFQDYSSKFVRETAKGKRGGLVGQNQSGFFGVVSDVNDPMYKRQQAMKKRLQAKAKRKRGEE